MNPFKKPGPFSRTQGHFHKPSNHYGNWVFFVVFLQEPENIFKIPGPFFINPEGTQQPFWNTGTLEPFMGTYNHFCNFSIFTFQPF